MSTMMTTFRELVSSVVSSPEKQILSLLNSPQVGSLPHSHQRSLSDHLSATRKILGAWNQPPEIQLAGLCHSVYSTEAYPHQAIPLSERSRVQKVIGLRAEHLAFLFSAIERRPLFMSVRAATSLRAKDRVTITTRPNLDAKEQSISGEEAAQLLILHLANMAEQSSERRGRPGVWLHHFTLLAQNLHKSDQTPPPVFSNGTVVLSRRDEMQLRDSYSLALMSAASDPEDSWTCLNECIELCPYLAELLIWKSYVAKVRRDDENQVACARQALNLLNDWNTSWDKRLPFSVWKEIAHELVARKLSPEKERRLHEMCLVERKTGINTSTRQGGRVSDNPEGVARLIQYLNRMAQEKSKSAFRWYPGLTQQEFHDPLLFSVVPALEAAFDEIAAEVRMLDGTGFHTEAEKIARSGSWKVFMLYEAGRKNESNCLRCPTITRIIEEHGCVRKSGGLIYLSRLGPHSEIASHRGPTNIRLRCHLAITVPSGDCGMRVGEKVMQWTEGKCKVFDDHYSHEVWNRTDASRIVLLVDLWHPDLTEDEKNALEAIQWYSYQHGLGLAKYWRKNEQQLSAENGPVASAMEAIDPEHRIHAGSAMVEEMDDLDH
jgi:hypothetical protein